MRHLTRLAFTLIALLCFAPLVSAQLVNPGTLLFTASPDHNTVDLGVAKLTEYQVEYVEAGTSAAAQSIPVGKPSPNASNDITVDLAALRPKLTVTPGSYTIRVVAKGPGGEARSTASAPFTLQVQAPAAPGLPRLQSSVARMEMDGGSNGPSSTGADVLRIAKWLESSGKTETEK